MRMIVHMGALAVLLLLFVAGIVVTMGQLVVVVVVGMPVGLVVPLAGNAAGMLMGHVVVIVTVCRRSMGMVGFSTFALGTLWRCHLFLSICADEVALTSTNVGRDVAAYAMPVALIKP